MEKEIYAISNNIRFGALGNDFKKRIHLTKNLRADLMKEEDRENLVRVLDQLRHIFHDPKQK